MSGDTLLSQRILFVRAKPEFLARFPHSRAWPTRDPLCNFCRDKLNLRGQLEREYIDLRTGKPVRRAFAEAFVAYLTERKRWQNVSVESSFKPVDGSAGPETEGAWAGPSAIFDAIAGHLRDHDEMYTENALRDVGEAARIVDQFVRTLQTIPGEWIGEMNSQRPGVEAMGWANLDAYQRWLLAMRDTEYRTVMFPVLLGKNAQGEAWRRVSTAVVFPLNEKTFRRIAAGEMGEHDMGPRDLQVPTRYLYLNATCEDVLLPDVNATDRMVAEARCMMYQMAYFTRGIRPFAPEILTMVTCRRYQERLRRHHYRETGTTLRGTDKKLVMFPLRKPSGRLYAADIPAYWLIRMCLRLYQHANSRIWRKEDAAMVKQT